MSVTEISVDVPEMRTSVRKMNTVAAPHRGRHSKTYMAWSNMRTRCLNTKHKKYKDYGGRGIIVCEEWNSFEQFLSDMGTAPKGHTLERIDNSSGYYKNNCIWATHAEQSRNKRSTINLTFNGETHCLSDWARIIKIPVYRLHWRVVHGGWSVERALCENTP